MQTVRKEKLDSPCELYSFRYNISVRRKCANRSNRQIAKGCHRQMAKFRAIQWIKLLNFWVKNKNKR